MKQFTKIIPTKVHVLTMITIGIVASVELESLIATPWGNPLYAFSRMGNAVATSPTPSFCPTPKKIPQEDQEDAYATQCEKCGKWYYWPHRSVGLIDKDAVKHMHLSQKQKANDLKRGRELFKKRMKLIKDSSLGPEDKKNMRQSYKQWLRSLIEAYQ